MERLARLEPWASGKDGRQGKRRAPATSSACERGPRDQISGGSGYWKCSYRGRRPAREPEVCAGRYEGEKLRNRGDVGASLADGAADTGVPGVEVGAKEVG